MDSEPRFVGIEENPLDPFLKRLEFVNFGGKLYSPEI